MEDVNVESSTTKETKETEEENVGGTQETQESQEGTQEADIQSQGTQVESPQTQTLPEQGQGSDVDEFGVPWKNRAMEMKRKYEDSIKKQDEILNKIDGLQGQQKQQYSEAELRSYANDPETNPQHRIWAEGEIQKLRNKEVSETVKKELDNYQSKQDVKVTQAQTYQSVQQRYPDAFLKDGNGAITSWNNASPLTQRISMYMQDPEIANNPRGLMVAASLAYSDIQLGQGQSTQAKTQQLKQQVRTLQKQTMVEGGGQNSDESKTPVRKAVDKSISGEMGDATQAMKEIFKASGQGHPST